MSIMVTTDLFHCSITSLIDFLGCQLRSILSIKSPIQKTSFQLSLGKEIHNIIASKLNSGIIPPMSEEASRILFEPCTIEGFNKEIYIEESVGNMDLNPTERYLDLLSNSYGVTPLPNGFYRVAKLGQEKGLEPNILDYISKNIISGSSLVEQELRTKMTAYGKTLEMVGIADLMSEDGTTIIDWKTSATSPRKDAPFDQITYYAQCYAYRYLYLKSRNLPLSPGKGCLVYIVKTKTPKLIFKPFEISLNNLLEIERLIRLFTRQAYLYLEDSTFPYPAYSEACSWCSYKDMCQSIYHIKPEEVTLACLELLNQN